MKKLGSNGPEISAIGFGAWEAGGSGWGPNPPEEQTIEAIRTAVDAGMNWIDTAEIYGGGRSEEMVGKAIKGLDVMVFTKVAPDEAGTGFRAHQIKAAAKKSLDRLGRDVIDLYQLHWSDRSVPIEETWGAMGELVDEGVIRYIGVSNFGQSLIQKCEAVRHVDSLQPQFSMFHQDGRDDLFKFCADNGTGIIVYGPLAFGLLTGAITKDTKFSDDDWRSGNTGMNYYEDLFAPGVKEKNLAKVEALRPIVEKVGCSLARLALAWTVHQHGVTGAIAGTRSPDHVRDNAGGGDVELTSEVLDEIESILGG
jgi:aryl-alcohol dehydrogenase-like predicted oxidoreductase